MDATKLRAIIFVSPFQLVRWEIFLREGSRLKAKGEQKRNALSFAFLILMSRH
jgi:hypothetical protein